MYRRYLPVFLFVVLLSSFVLYKFKYQPQSALELGCPVNLTETGEVNPSETLAVWENRQFTFPIAFDNKTIDPSRVLGAVSDDKWIEVDLSEQRLIAHEGDTVYLDSLISSGLPGFNTPPGEYRIWYKIRSTKMSGGSKENGTYYYLPNVPYAMFFKGSYGIHGTYWHSNFGHVMSHGCVNAPTPTAEKLFYWVGPTLPVGKLWVRATPENPGTRVVVHQ